MRALVLALAWALAWSAAPAAAQGLDDLERAVREAMAVRDKLAAERQPRALDASRLADEIADLKRRATRPRADRALEQRLQAFDRVASALDDLDQRIRNQERVLAQARARFMARADADLATLAQQRGGANAAAVALRIEAIETAHRRVRADAGEARAIRRALDIALAPADGLSEVEAKLALLRSERQRLADASADLKRELAVIDTRLTLKRQLARELESATRDPGATSGLVQRELDDLLASIKELEARRETLARDADTLPQDLGQLDSRMEALTRRARQLSPPGSAGEIR
jgi:chromosome segregation ATPase